MPELILASQSLQRSAILQSIKLDFLTVPAHLDEAHFPEKKPLMRAEKLARAKAKAIAQLHPEACIIGADTYVLLGDAILEKPQTKSQATEMLRALSGNESVAVSGLAVIYPALQYERSATVQTKIRFKQLSEDRIAAYVAQNPVTTWSGGFSCHYPAGKSLIETIDGSETGLNGLPIETLIPWLRECGVLIY